MSESRTSAGGELNRQAKAIEWWPLIRAVVPLVAAALGGSVLYLYLAVSTDVTTVYLGVPLMLAGLVCALLGFRIRLREIRTSDEPNTRGYALLFLGWACTVVGLTLPFYLLA